MNTYPHVLAQILRGLRKEGVLQTKTIVMESICQLHGDLCFVGGFSAVSLKTTAANHDPRHRPYGIQWSVTPTLAQPAPYCVAVEGQRKTVHQNLPPSSPRGCTRQARVLTGLASGFATEQSLPADSVTVQQQSASPSRYNASRSATEQHSSTSTVVDAQPRGASPPPPEPWQPQPEPPQVQHPTSQAHLWRAFERLVYEFWSGGVEVVFTSPGTGGWYPSTSMMTWRGEVVSNEKSSTLPGWIFGGAPLRAIWITALGVCARPT